MTILISRTLLSIPLSLATAYALAAEQSPQLVYAIHDNLEGKNRVSTGIKEAMKDCKYEGTPCTVRVGDCASVTDMPCEEVSITLSSAGPKGYVFRADKDRPVPIPCDSDNDTCVARATREGLRNLQCHHANQHIPDPARLVACGCFRRK